jgi:hypothetical protein
VRKKDEEGWDESGGGGVSAGERGNKRKMTSTFAMTWRRSFQENCVYFEKMCFGPNLIRSSVKVMV